jgi:hypothetical protein
MTKPYKGDARVVDLVNTEQFTSQEVVVVDPDADLIIPRTRNPVIVRKTTTVTTTQEIEFPKGTR